MKAAVRFVAVTIAGYALFELYLALRPDDLTQQFRDFLATRHGQFETYYVERRNAHERSSSYSGSPPIGE